MDDGPKSVKTQRGTGETQHVKTRHSDRPVLGQSPHDEQPWKKVRHN